MSENLHINNIFSAEEEECLSLDQMKGYQAGTLVGEEKHYVERHLLNCELCSLAYEGVVAEDAATIQAGAEEIAAMAWDRIEAKKKRRGAMVWVSAAAGVMLLVTVGYFVLKSPQKTDMVTLAEQYDHPPEAPGDLSDAEDGAKTDPAETGSVRTNADDFYAAAEEAKDLEEKAKVPPPPNAIVESEPGMMEVIEEVEEVEEEIYEGDDFAEVMPEDEIALEDGMNTVPPVMSGGGKTAANTGSSMGKADGNIRNFNTQTKDATVQQLQKNKAETKSLELAADDFDADIGAEDESGFDDAPMGGVTISDRSVDKKELDEVAVEMTEKPVEIVGKIESKSIRNQPQEMSSVAVDARKAKGKKRSNDRKRNGGKGKANRAKAASPEMDFKSSDNNVANERNEEAQRAYYNEGIEAYRQKDYQKSSDYLRRAAQATPDNLNAHYYAAASFLEINQPSAAIYHLDRILAVPGNSLYEDAEWYKAMALMKLNDEKKAKKLLETIKKRGGKYTAKATEVLEKL